MGLILKTFKFLNERLILFRIKLVRNILLILSKADLILVVLTTYGVRTTVHWKYIKTVIKRKISVTS